MENGSVSIVFLFVLGIVDWSRPVTHQAEEELVLNWDDDDDVAEHEDADSPPLSMKLDKKEITDGSKETEKSGKLM